MAFCVDRHREKYCPKGDGTYKFPYSTNLIQSGIRVDLTPSDFIQFGSVIEVPLGLNDNTANLGSLDRDFHLNSGGTNSPLIDPLVAGAFSWWSPAGGFRKHEYAGTTLFIQELPPDDLIAQIMNNLEDVQFSLTVSRTGTAYHGEMVVDHDGGGGYVAVKLVDTTTPLSDIQTLTWSRADVKARITSSSTCFQVRYFPIIDPFQAGNVEVDGQLIWLASAQYSGTNRPSLASANPMRYDAVVWNAPTFTWNFAYYTYSKTHYSCCGGCGGCPTPVKIPSGGTQTICLTSEFVDCNSLPQFGSITGPEPFADRCNVLSVGQCSATISVPCLHQDEIDAGGFEGPYTVTEPGKDKCYQGGQYLCELLTGTFYISAGRVCTEVSEGGGIDILHWREGYFMADGGASGLHIARRWHPEVPFDFMAPVDVSTGVTHPKLSHREEGPPLGVVYSKGTGKDAAIYRRESYDYGETWEGDPAPIKSGENGVIHADEVWNERTGERVNFYNDQSEKDSRGNVTGRGVIYCDVYGPDRDDTTGQMKKNPDGPFRVTPAGKLADNSSFGAIYIRTSGAIDCVAFVEGVKHIYRSHDDARTWQQDT